MQGKDILNLYQDYIRALVVLLEHRDTSFRTRLQMGTALTQDIPGHLSTLARNMGKLYSFLLLKELTETAENKEAYFEMFEQSLKILHRILAQNRMDKNRRLEIFNDYYISRFEDKPSAVHMLSQLAEDLSLINP